MKNIHGVKASFCTIYFVYFKIPNFNFNVDRELFNSYLIFITFKYFHFILDVVDV
jgi:hypothetical protein